ncbi:hypothetical protein FNF29_05626 [Cafeteria roenbergensis]|uniref:Cullin family profile domain-containing protein n=1 Tax=Cafeteria roenbergensis TaxID=33653 RepID=A0A5A8CA56_CAFRO|nr:hypothetical protein FNF29_05626 [Cafeteria roenbergensis]KAA0158264.1 hypothetical protein FNF28_06320 [Cafeteria roenbergensis]|eukprot:KAA0150006.1 hypothetical protein FNF29_05626 [Cafeteria roenbergensis]
MAAARSVKTRASRKAGVSFPGISELPKPAQFATCSAAEAKASEKEFVAFIQPRLPNSTAVGGEDLEEILTVWGADLVSDALAMGLDKVTGTVMPRMVFSKLSTFVKRVVEQGAVFPGDEYTGLAAGIAIHERVVGRQLRERVLPELKAATGEMLLSQLVKHWNEHKVFVRWLRRIFTSLDQLDSFAQRRVASLSESGMFRSRTTAGLLQFGEVLFAEDSQSNVMEHVLALVDEFRKGCDVDRSLIKGVAELFVLVGLLGSKVHANVKDVNDMEALAKSPTALDDNDSFVKWFQDPYCKRTSTFYSARSDEWFASGNMSEFCAAADKALATEQSLALATLNPKTWEAARESFLDAVLLSRLDDVVRHSTGLALMIREQRLDDIACMYRVLSQFGDGAGAQKMAELISEYMTEAGDGILKKRASEVQRAVDAKDLRADIFTEDSDFIEALIALMTFFNSMVAEQCADDPAIRQVVSNVMRKLVNCNALGESDQHPTAELIAKYVDKLMCEGTKSSASPDQPQHAVTLFAFVNDRDLFQESHRNLLSKRLLSGSTASYDDERDFIGLLKAVVGPTFTTKFEGMLTDILTPDASLKAFQEARKAKRSPLDMDVTILCHGHWPPAFPTPAVRLTDALYSAADEFETYYRSKQASRKVSFALAEGTMTVRGFFSKGGKDAWYDFSCNTLQGLHLLRFNESESWKCADLASAVGVSPADCTQLIKPFVFSSSCRVIIDKTLADDHKAGKKIRKVVEPEHTLVFNLKFSSKKKAVKVPDVQLKETANKAAIDVGRKHVLDAAIVRIMKTRKTLKLQALVLETEAQARRLFAPDPRLTKKRIEHLIEQDYLERDDGDRGLLHYVA